MTRFRSTVPMLAWLVVICWACQVWAAGPEHFDVSATYLEFTLSSPPADDEWIQDDLKTIVNIFQGQEQKNQELKYRITQIEPSDAQIADLIAVRVAGGTLVKMGNQWVTFAASGATSATVEFYVHPEIFWRGTGEYRVTLSSYEQKAPPIVLHITVSPYAMITSINPQRIVIHVTSGPGRYCSEPVDVTVRANHSNWRVRLEAKQIVHEDYPEVPAAVEPGEMFLAIEESGSFHTFRPLEVSDKWGTWYGQTITPAEFLRSASYYTVTAKFAADIDWHHVTGKYSGIIDLTLESLER